jgi:hypothetical protein
VTNWVANSGATNHTTPHPGHIFSPRPPSLAQPSSIVVGNGSVLPATSVGDSVLPGPFYLNDVLLPHDLVQSLLSVRRFTTDNSYYMEFDSFGLSMKDLATRRVLARYDNTGPLYTLPLHFDQPYPASCPVCPGYHCFLYQLASSPWPPRPRCPLQAVK